MTLRFEIEDGAEIWRRDFDGRAMVSKQSLGTGRHQGLLIERVGIFNLGLALVEDSGRLKLVARSFDVCGLPLPKFLAPILNAYEYAIGDRFHFHVELGVPLLGSLVRYEGWLGPTGCGSPTRDEKERADVDHDNRT